MALITSLKKDGSPWTPEFVMELNPESCIGCGRCYKACAHDVLTLEEVEDDIETRINMVIANDGNCVGCLACSKACPKDCFTHAPAEA